MLTVTRDGLWAARHVEQERLTLFTRQRRNVYGEMGGNGAERATELDILILKTGLLIDELTDQICELA